MSEKKKIRISLRDKAGGRTITVTKDPFIIGRSNTADVQIKESHISRHHLKVLTRDDQIFLIDLGSGNGSSINDRQINSSEECEYKTGDVVTFGKEKSVSITMLIEQAVQKVAVNDSYIDHDATVVRSNVLSINSTPSISTGDSSEETLNEDHLLDQFKTIIRKSREDISVAAKREADRIIEEALQNAQKTNAECEELTAETTERARKIIDDAKNEALKIREESEEELKEQELHVKGIIESERKQAEEEISFLRKTLNEVEKKSESLKELCVTKENELIEVEDEFSKIKREIEISRDNLKAFTAELEQKRKTGSDEIKRLEEKMVSLVYEERTRKAKLEAELAESAAQVSRGKIEVQAVLEEKRHLEMQGHRIKAEFEGIKQETDEIKKTRDIVNLELLTVRSEVLSSKNMIEQAKKDKEMFLAQISDERKRLQDEGQKINQRLAKLEDEKEATKRDCERMMVEAQKRVADYDKQVNEKQRQLAMAIDRLEDKKLKIEAEISLVEEEKKRILLKSTEEAAKIIELANCEKETILKETQETVSAKMDAAVVDANKLIAQARDEIERKIYEAGATANKIITEAKQNSGIIISRANTESTSIVENAHAVAQKELAEATDKSKSIIDKAIDEARANQAAQQKTLAELKHLELTNINGQREKMLKEMSDKREEYAKKVSTNVFAFVASAMTNVKTKVIDDELIEEFTRGLKELVEDLMLDKQRADANKLQSILKTSENAKLKEKKYWRRLTYMSSALMTFLVVIVVFPSIITGPRDMILNLFKDKGVGTSDQFLNEVIEKREQAIYRPVTTPEYKDNYVDNYLFTTGYMTEIKAKEFHDEWIVELNDFFINKLEVKDTTIIKFVSLESGFYKDLEKVKEQIVAATPEPKIEEMRQLESAFKQRLSEFFQDPGKVDRFYEFKKNFWNEYTRRKNATPPVPVKTN